MIGEKIIELDRVDSTNACAGKLWQNGRIEDGDVIWAHEQYSGRGQGDHSWISEPGRNLTLTVVLQPVFVPPDRQFLLNKAVSLGVADFVQTALGHASTGSQLLSVSVKWPNDIYVGNLKIGGILIENKIMGSVLETSFAGIGVNLNQSSFPPDIPNPVSLIRLIGRETPIKESLQSLCRHLDRRYVMLKTGNITQLDHDYCCLLLGYGQWRSFSVAGKTLEGKIAGVNDLGQLLVQNRAGALQTFNHMEIEYML